MKKRWTEYLPPAIRRLLGRLKTFVYMPFFKIFYKFFVRQPIQGNKIIFDNYQGRGFGCNPKYIAQKLIGRGSDQYDLVWLVSRKHMLHSELPPQIRPVRYGSLRAFYEYATAKIWVSNYPKMYFVRNGVRKREGQFFIQTCHGSLGIKKIDGDVLKYTQRKHWLRAAIAGSKMTDYWISNSAFETNVYKSAFWDVRDDAVLLYGHPRNDIFFDAEMMYCARRKIAELYDIKEKKILLYAPTFRENPRIDCYRIDYANLLTHICQRFGGDWVILVRLHPQLCGLSDKIIPVIPETFDATPYMDMQELLVAADCLITDYSSCAFDFLLTRRPVFLFATDVQEYDVERGFYYPLDDTPFPLAHDNAELMKNIDEFDEASYLSKVEAFLQEMGCIEDGRASERVADLIEELMRY